MTPEDRTRDFFCPFCRSNHFKLISVTSMKTKRFTIVDGLYQCAGCSTVFTDPEAFTQLVQDSIIDAPRCRDRQPTREYPPDAVTVWKRRDEPDDKG